MTSIPPRRNYEFPPACQRLAGLSTIAGLAISLAATATASTAAAQTNPDVAPALRQALAVEVRLLATPNEHSPLRAVLANVRRAWRVPIVADRRVDPDHNTPLSVSNANVEAVIQAMAETQKLGATGLGPIVYLGPPGPAGKLLTLSALRHDEARKLPEEAAARWLAKAPLAWPERATPRKLLEQLARENELAIAGLERVPHDLWAGVNLPPLALVDRFTLIAIQYDLTFQIGDDGASLELVPIPERVVVVRSYPGGRDPAATADRFTRLAPEAEVRVSNGKVYVRGRVEDHHRLLGPTSAGPATTAKPKSDVPAKGTRLFTFQTRPGALDVLLPQLGKALDLDVRLDRTALEAAGISPTQQVSVAVKDATVDQIFQTLLKSTGCAFRRKGNVVEVFPAP